MNLKKFLFHQMKNAFEIIRLETRRTFQNTAISAMQSVGCYQQQSLHPPKAHLLHDLAKQVSGLTCSGAELLTHS